VGPSAESVCLATSARTRSLASTSFWVSPCGGCGVELWIVWTRTGTILRDCAPRVRFVRGCHHGTLVHRCWLLLESVNAVGGLLGGEDQHHEHRVMKNDAIVKIDGGCPSPCHRRQIAWPLLLLRSCRPSGRLTTTWNFLVTGCSRSWSALVASCRRCEIWTDPQASRRKPPTSNPCPKWRGSKSSATGENRTFTTRK
jgi:hypothetical protein